MRSLATVGLMLGVAVGLSGCVVYCDDGKPLIQNGKEVIAEDSHQARDIANQYCPKKQNITDPLNPDLTPPPVPTNFVPFAGLGAGVLGAAALSGGGDGGSSSSTNGTN